MLVDISLCHGTLKLLRHIHAHIVSFHSISGVFTRSAHEIFHQVANWYAAQLRRIAHGHQVLGKPPILKEKARADWINFHGKYVFDVLPQSLLPSPSPVPFETLA